MFNHNENYRGMIASVVWMDVPLILCVCLGLGSQAHNGFDSLLAFASNLDCFLRLENSIWSTT